MPARSLQNKKVVITAGPTREYWDPVRFLTNGSSGAMGIALAESAARLGARVTLILGPTCLRPGRRVKVDSVTSGWDMYQAVKKHLPNTDYFIGAAAVADYRPAEKEKKKLKTHTPYLSLALQSNPDIIAMVGHLKKRPSTVIGFALETDHLFENAREKLFRKRMDWILANNESNMGQAVAAGTLLSRWGHQFDFKRMPKKALAERLWKTILSEK